MPEKGHVFTKLYHPGNYIFAGSDLGVRPQVAAPAGVSLQNPSYFYFSERTLVLIIHPGKSSCEAGQKQVGKRAISSGGNAEVAPQI